MTAQGVSNALGKIRALALDDDESAHIAEDLLYAEVLQSIAEGSCENAAECARLALTSEMIEFSRWYA